MDLHQAGVVIGPAGVEALGASAVHRPATRRVHGLEIVEVGGVADLDDDAGPAPRLELLFRLWEPLTSRHAAEAVQKLQQLVVTNIQHVVTESLGGGGRHHRKRHRVDAPRIDLQQPRTVAGIESDGVAAAGEVVTFELALLVRKACVGRQPNVADFLADAVHVALRNQHPCALKVVLWQFGHDLPPISASHLHDLGHGAAVPGRALLDVLSECVDALLARLEVLETRFVLDDEALQRHVLRRKRRFRVVGHQPAPGLLGQPYANALPIGQHLGAGDDAGEQHGDVGLCHPVETELRKLMLLEHQDAKHSAHVDGHRLPAAGQARNALQVGEVRRLLEVRQVPGQPLDSGGIVGGKLRVFRETSVGARRIHRLRQSGSAGSRYRRCRRSGTHESPRTSTPIPAHPWCHPWCCWSATRRR